MIAMKSATSIMAVMALLLADAEAKSIFDANTFISQWINPNALFGIFFMILFFWVCLCVLQALSAVQTPRIMLEKCIDWGKVEQTED